jgi:serine/threonine protein kinase
MNVEKKFLSQAVNPSVGNRVSPTDIQGPIQLHEPLGTGGMSTVYRVTCAKTGNTAAARFLTGAWGADPRVQARFDREIAILKSLRHPNIVSYFGDGRHGPRRFYVMELMTGGTLDDRLREQGALAWGDVIEFGIQICRALEFAHVHGIIHRDLKPGNLFFNGAGTLKLGDFGIARDLGAASLTAAENTVGTYAYVAPEQIHGRWPISRQTDLYAFGCVLFEMITGEKPFQADSEPEILLKHMTEEPPRVKSVIPECPPLLDDYVAQLLKKSPKDRPADARSLQWALQDVRKIQFRIDRRARGDGESSGQARGTPSSSFAATPPGRNGDRSTINGLLRNTREVIGARPFRDSLTPETKEFAVEKPHADRRPRSKVRGYDNESTSRLAEAT